MDQTRSSESVGGESTPPSPLRESFDDAIAYWELRRIPYNLVLSVVFLAWIGLTWPHFRDAFTAQHILILFVLALMANVCYCAAYLADIPMQRSLHQYAWRRWRWALWGTGMLFAILIANYWIADEIYPYL